MCSRLPFKAVECPEIVLTSEMLTQCVFQCTIFCECIRQWGYMKVGRHSRERGCSEWTNMKFAPRLSPAVFHFDSACSERLPERLSCFFPFLLCSDVPTFSPVFNGLTVFSTVTFGGAPPAFCGLLCTSGRAIRCQPLVVASILPPIH